MRTTIHDIEQNAIGTIGTLQNIYCDLQTNVQMDDDCTFTTQNVLKLGTFFIDHFSHNTAGIFLSREKETDISSRKNNRGQNSACEQLSRRICMR